MSLNPAPVSGPEAIVTGTRIPTPELTSTKAVITELPLTTNGGTSGVSLATIHGLLKLSLPDDIRAGDTISGSLVTEPKGANDEEKAKNNQVLETFVIDVDGTRVSFGPGPFSFGVPSNEAKPGEFTSGKMDMRVFQPSKPNEIWKIGLTHTLKPSDVKPSQANTFTIPHLSQPGRPVEIHGPFDGDASNTRVSIGTGSVIKPLAESPRKVVFIAPVDVTGPYTIDVKEGDKTFAGTARNIAVRLSAPKLDLLRGEKTTLTIEVSGLTGINKDVPLQLDARGVINMDGGNFQNLRIKPEEVKPDGRYTTNRTINALQAGGFSVTATVIVGPFDICLQDDVDPNRLFQFNSFTGDYSFTDFGAADQARTSGLKLQPGGGGGAAQTGKLQPGGGAGGGGAAQTGAGGAPPTGSTPGAVIFTGIGKPAMKGCIITLSHNAPDRRVFAKLDVCTNSGDAKVETKASKATSEVTDKSTENNSCPSSPK